jgi:DNA-binding transcriptional ArsR family regulator
LRTRDVFVALEDPTRGEILELLRDAGPLNAGAVAASFRGATRPAISRHLRVLRECRLVKARARGREQLYALDERPLVRAREEWFARFGAGHAPSLRALRRAAESAR